MEATGVTQAAGKLQDAQLEAQAAEPLVSTSLSCKLTNAASFPSAQITVFRGWGVGLELPPEPLQVSQDDTDVPDRLGFSSSHDNEFFPPG